MNFQRIRDLHVQGHLHEAEDALHEWIRSYGDSPEAYFRLGAIAFATGHIEDAERYLQRAVNLAPAQPSILHLQGAVFQARGRIEEAEGFFRKAVALAPRMLPAYHSLGLLLLDAGRHDDAITVLRAALSITPHYAAALNSLALAYQATGRRTDALASLDAAVASEPDFVEAWTNLSVLRAGEGHVAQALEAFGEAWRLAPTAPDLLSRLAAAMEQSGETDRAIQALRRLVEIQPGSVDALLELGRLYASINETEAAAAAYRAVLDNEPARLRAHLGLCLTLPVVYPSEEALAAARRKFEEGLAELSQNVRMFSDAGCLDDLCWSNFHLAYQGQHDLTLQKAYAKFCAELLCKHAPDLMADGAGTQRPQGRLRVGFASASFTQGTIAGYFQSWISRLDKTKFESFVYCVGHAPDQVTEEIAATADHFVMLASPKRTWLRFLAERIRQDELDVLIYPELGMSPVLFPLGALRLARVQCVAWGHPETTGFQNIDYYLSCASMEPPGAKSHYSESLVLLPSVGTCYARPKIPEPARRTTFRLPEDRHLYLFSHAPFKIHPENDALLANILLQDPKASIVLVEGRHANLTRAITGRLRQALDLKGVSVDRLIVLPYLSRPQFLQLNLLCDVALDSLHWSGGNTSLDALACCLPVVTIEGDLMRGRQTAAMLRMIGLESLIAKDAVDYVEKAVSLAIDSRGRLRIQNQIRQSQDVLFGQLEPIRALEAFLQRSIAV